MKGEKYVEVQTFESILKNEELIDRILNFVKAVTHPNAQCFSLYM